MFKIGDRVRPKVKKSVPITRREFSTTASMVRLLEENEYFVIDGIRNEGKLLYFSVGFNWHCDDFMLVAPDNVIGGKML